MFVLMRKSSSIIFKNDFVVLPFIVIVGILVSITPPLIPIDIESVLNRTSAIVASNATIKIFFVCISDLENIANTFTSVKYVCYGILRLRVEKFFIMSMPIFST